MSYFKYHTIKKSYFLFAGCVIGGKTYSEGEVFDSPIDKCTKCMCKVRGKKEYLYKWRENHMRLQLIETGKTKHTRNTIFAAVANKPCQGVTFFVSYSKGQVNHHFTFSF